MFSTDYDERFVFREDTRLFSSCISELAAPKLYISAKAGNGAILTCNLNCRLYAIKRPLPYQCAFTPRLSIFGCFLKIFAKLLCLFVSVRAFSANQHPVYPNCIFFLSRTILQSPKMGSSDEESIVRRAYQYERISSGNRDRSRRYGRRDRDRRRRDSNDRRRYLAAASSSGDDSTSRSTYYSGSRKRQREPRQIMPRRGKLDGPSSIETKKRKRYSSDDGHRRSSASDDHRDGHGAKKRYRGKRHSSESEEVRDIFQKLFRQVFQGLYY